jgi:aspartate aminotransferase-like enzyme
MSPSAQRAMQDFVRFAGENGGTLYFETLLKNGWEAWPFGLQARFAGLHHWKGVGELKQSLRHVAGAVEDVPVLLAARTAKLVELAARTLFRSCKRVLLTDLTWPSYARIFRRLARQMGREIIPVSIRSAILERQASPQEVIERIANAYSARRCEAMFLPEVSHDGIRLPWPRLVQLVRQEAGPAFMVIDGGQAFGQVSIDLSSIPCDFYVAGSHKWLGAYLPLGVGFCPSSKTATLIRQGIHRIDDPLLRFLERMETKDENRFSETVNMTPLFSCRAAIADLGAVASDLAVRRANAESLIARIGAYWQPMVPHDEFHSGIVLVKARNDELQRWDPDHLRAKFLVQRVALTAYSNGLLRLAMPATPWTARDLDALAKAFSTVGRHRHGIAPIPSPPIPTSVGEIDCGPISQSRETVL